LIIQQGQCESLQFVYAAERFIDYWHVKASFERIFTAKMYWKQLEKLI